MLDHKFDYPLHNPLDYSLNHLCLLGHPQDIDLLLDFLQLLDNRLGIVLLLK
jgi:hypothetical protein